MQHGQYEDADHIKHLLEFQRDIERLYRQSEFCDISLVIGRGPSSSDTNASASSSDQHRKEKGHVIRAHRSILAARCSYFASLFSSGMRDSQQTTLYFPDKNYKDFKVLIDFFYTAQLNISEANAYSVLKLADEFGVAPVRTHCISFVMANIVDDNVFDVLEESLFHGFEELTAYCKHYIERHASVLFSAESTSFLALSKDALCLLLDSDKIQLSEIEIFLSVVEWGKWSVKSEKSGGSSSSGKSKSSGQRRVKTAIQAALQANHRTTAESDASSQINPSMQSVASAPRLSVSSEDGAATTAEAEGATSTAASSAIAVPSASSQSQTSALRRRPRAHSESMVHNLRGGLSQLSPSELGSYDEQSLLSMTEQLQDGADADELTEADEIETPYSPTSPTPHHNHHSHFPVGAVASQQAAVSSSSGPNSNTSTLIRLQNAAQHITMTSTVTVEFNTQLLQQLKDRAIKVFDYRDDCKMVAKLREVLAAVFEHVRFPTLSPQEIFEFVEPSLVVPQELLLEAYRVHALADRISLQTSRVKVREGSIFWHPGVLAELPISWLRGWTLCYQAPYSEKTSPNVFDNVRGTRILVAGRAKGSSVLTLAAMGRKEFVLRETIENNTTLENGVYFYHWRAHSFGFSDKPDIQLGSADLSHGRMKLSWHLTGRGGYRLGEHRALNESDAFEKLIFYS